MRGIAEAVYELLKSYASGRVYNLRAPQNETAPFIVFNVLETESDSALEGLTDYWTARLQVDVYSETIADAREISAQIVESLGSYQGIVYYGDGSPKDSISLVMIHEKESELIDQTDEPLLYRSSGEWNLTKGET
jgi:hypothetical protein